MIRYKRKDTKNGRIMYFRNGKMCSPESIPNSILQSLTDGQEIEIDTPDPETIDQTEVTKPHLKSIKKCIFCGKDATRTRFINLEVANLCLEDHQNHTTGQVAAQMKEKVVNVQ